MSPRLLLSGSMIALAVLAAGHTAATLGRESTGDANVAAAFAAMKSAIVPRTARWLPRSMADFDLGMNLNLTFALVAVIALLALLLPSVGSHPQLVVRLLLPLLFFTLAAGATSLWFFSSLPATGLCLVAAFLIAAAAVQLLGEPAR